MTPDDLRAAGEALFGPHHWQTGLSVLLLGKRSSETSRIRNWLAGEAIPPGVRRDLVKAMRQRATLITKTADRLVDGEGR
jgi:hypothetical protein